MTLYLLLLSLLLLLLLLLLDAEEKEEVCGKGNEDRTGNVHSPSFLPMLSTTADSAELIANKKGESYSSAISWIKAKVSFATVRSAILCLRGSKSRRRQIDFVDSDSQIETIRACPN